MKQRTPCSCNRPRARARELVRPSSHAKTLLRELDLLDASGSLDQELGEPDYFDREAAGDWTGFDGESDGEGGSEAWDLDAPPPRDAENELEQLEEPGRDLQIIGTDERKRITDPRKVPFRRVCKLEMRFAHGRFLGTGTLVGHNKVLTAAHNIFSRTPGKVGPVQSVRVIPAKNGIGRTRVQEPFGSTAARRVHMDPRYRTTPRTSSIDREVRPFDYAVLTLRDPIGRRAGYFDRIRVLPASKLRRLTVNTAGYPGDKGGNHPYWAYKQIVAVRNNILEYEHDTAPGQSGSSLWVKWRGVRSIIGVHIRRDDAESRVVANIGVQITPAVLAQIQQWLRA